MKKWNTQWEKRLWHTACIENNREELCRLFCNVDNVTYGGLKKLGNWWVKTASVDIKDKITIRTANTMKKILELCKK